MQGDPGRHGHRLRQPVWAEARQLWGGHQEGVHLVHHPPGIGTRVGKRQVLD